MTNSPFSLKWNRSDRVNRGSLSRCRVGSGGVVHRPVRAGVVVPDPVHSRCEFRFVPNPVPRVCGVVVEPPAVVLSVPVPVQLVRSRHRVDSLVVCLFVEVPVVFGRVVPNRVDRSAIVECKFNVADIHGVVVLCHFPFEAVLSKVPECSAEVTFLVVGSLPKVTLASAFHGFPGSFSSSGLIALGLATFEVLATLVTPVALSSALLA